MRSDMKILAVIFNIIFFLFTLFVLATDGFPKQVGYLLVTLFVLLTPILSLIVILHIGENHSRMGLPTEDNSLKEISKIDNKYNRTTILRIIAILLNILLLGYVCWAIFQPHPAEEGYIPYVILVLLTPILNLLVFYLLFYRNQKTSST
jgi:hypothetical protein